MTKRRTAFSIFIMLCLAALLLASVIVLPRRICFKGSESYSFYLGNTSADCREVIVDGQAAHATRLFLGKIGGESATYKSLDLERFLAEVDGEIVKTQEIDGTMNYYCKANLPYSINLFGEEINLHVCVRADSVKVGTPIIFGGY
ncbi:MAG: hypothetical protein K2N47_04400 [Clostridia bacterium]|nr:hypothetical protein [Clostridia bacterium]